MATENETEKDKDHPDNKKLSSEGWSSLRERKRHCTDCLCLLLLIAVWIAMTVVGFIVTGLVKSELLNRGNPLRLLNEIDYDGRICGYDSEVKDQPNAYYLSTGAAVCVKHCPARKDYYSFICMEDDQEEADNNYIDGWELVSKGRCMYYLPTDEYLNRCIYSGGSNSSTPNGLTSVDYGGDQARSWVSDFFADMYKLRGFIFGFGIGISLFLSFFYLYFLRIPGVLSLMIWTIVLGIFFILLIGSILLYSLSVKWANSDNRTGGEVTTMKVLSIIGFILTALYTCLICVLRKRILLAIGIVKEAARALSAMPIIIFMPVFQCIAIVVFLVPWVIYSLYLASSGTIKVHETTAMDGTTTQYRTMEYSNNQRYAFLYLLFCWYWTSEFILACGQIISAMSISAWYFTRDKKSEGNGSVLWALRVTIFNHLGTAAYGSLIIAIIKTIRAILAYLQKKAQKSGNKLAVFILSCLQCCMWCLEKCMRFLNKNAYIQTAIYGYSFCKACRAAFFLIARNVLRVFAVSMVGDFVLFLGRICVPLLTTLLCYLALVYSMGDEIAGIIGPMIITFILAYFVACLFVEVFGMAISTILVCYCADEEMFPPEERFADGALRGAIKTTQAASSGQIVPEEQNEKGEALF